jgi:anti-anti-sigma regulatory factor
MVVNLSENIGIKNIMDFFCNIKNAMDVDGEIVLDFAKVKRIDLSVLQVLIAASREAAEKGKLFKFRSASEPVKKQLMLGGMTNFHEV